MRILKPWTNSIQVGQLSTGALKAENFFIFFDLISDNVRLSVDGKFAERDIVQFVPLNKFLSNSGPYIKSQADLAKEVLAEVPGQLTSFMKSHGYKPQIAPPSDFQSDASAIMPTAPKI